MTSPPRIAIFQKAYQHTFHVSMIMTLRRTSLEGTNSSLTFAPSNSKWSTRPSPVATFSSPGRQGAASPPFYTRCRGRLKAKGLNVHVIAPTGIVVLAVNGTTTWSFAGWSPDSNKRTRDKLIFKIAKPTRKQLQQADVVIIDEISIIKNNHFSRLDYLLRQVRGRALGKELRSTPCGGVQIIVTGDFCQLPPIKHCADCGKSFRKEVTYTPSEQRSTTRVCVSCKLSFDEEDKFAFSSVAWRDCNFVIVHLKAIHRQKDPAFISLLQRCRLGFPFSPQEIKALTGPKPEISPRETVKLFPLREEVRRTNEIAFKQLTSPPIAFTCQDTFFEKRPDHRAQYGRRMADGTLDYLDQHRFERSLLLKKDMRVLLLPNSSLDLGLCNGSQGQIIDFKPFDPARLPAKETLRGYHVEIREYLIKKFAQSHLEKGLLGEKGFGWPVLRFDNGIIKTIYPECQVSEVGSERPYSLTCRTQIPLTAEYALSIHKAQGMTLDKVIVDLSRTFEERQVYVALSKAKSVEAPKVIGLGGKRGTGGWSDVEGAGRVRKFLRQTFGEEAVSLRPGLGLTEDDDDFSLTEDEDELSLAEDEDE